MSATEDTTAGPRSILLEEVVQSFDGATDPRQREIAQGVVRHLHELVAELRLDHEEWRQAIAFLTEVGQMCSDTRQEFILLSDTLGVSSLLEIVAVDPDPAATENTVLGPFYVPGSPLRELGASILEEDDPGQRALVQGRVTDLEGRPLAGAELDVWQNGTNRLYAVQDPEQSPTNLRGRFHADEDGRFAFRAVRPVPYTVPADGPVGRMLAATGRHPWRPAHVHVMVSAPGYRTLVTHVFDAESEYLDGDTVFGVRDSLIVRFEPDEDEGTVARFDVALEPQR